MQGEDDKTYAMVNSTTSHIDAYQSYIMSTMMSHYMEG